jgi:Tol biopolymer transport system component
VNRFAAALLVLCAALDPPLDARLAEVLTITQRDALRLHKDRASVDVSADGRYVAFTSYARLVPADADTRDVYVLDRSTEGVALESLALDGIVDSNSGNPTLSDDGRFLAYDTHLSAGNAEPLNILLRDRRDGLVRILSRGVAGEPANGASHSPSISSDGRLVAFTSAATNLTAGIDASGASTAIYTVDVASGIVTRIGSGVSPSVGATARYVAFASSVDVDPRNHSDVYVHDTRLGTTTRVSLGRGGRAANARSWAPAISADGRYVAFVSAASNLVTGDDNQSPDVFVTDWQLKSMELVSLSAKRRSGNDASSNPAISADGRFVAFQSEASNLPCTVRGACAMEDINLLPDVFLFDRQTKAMTRISGDEAGPWMEASVGPALDADARVVAFSSRHPIGEADRHNDFDLFISHRRHE